MIPACSTSLNSFFMKNLNYAFLMGLIFICLFFMPAASAMEEPGTETILFTLQGEPTDMIIDGDRLFWLQDSKFLNYTERGIYVYNFSDDSKRCIRRIPPPSDRGTWSFYAPVISGNLIVYQEGKAIMLTNISTGRTTQLTNSDDETVPVSALKYNQNPWVDGDKIVWTEHNAVSYSSVSGGKIVLYNLTNGEKQYVPVGAPGNQNSPVISGDDIVWRDYRQNGENCPDLYHFNLITEQENMLPTENPVIGMPFVMGDQVIWTEMIQGVHTIVDYSLSSQTRTVIGPGSVDDGHVPSLSERRIVWLKSKNPLNVREESGAVMVMDLHSGEKSQLTPFERGLSFPAIAGDRIIYTRGAGEDEFREQREVVLYTLPPLDSDIEVGSDAGTGNASGNSSPPSAVDSLAQKGANTALPGFSFITIMVSLVVCIAGVALWRLWR